MSNGFETCDKHTYLFATEAKDCPYCRIAELEQQLAEAKREIDVKQRVLDEYYGIAGICNNLTNELAEAREEVERLKSPLVDAPAAYENGRKQAVQEIIEEVIGDWNCD